MDKRAEEPAWLPWTLLGGSVLGSVALNAYMRARLRDAYGNTPRIGSRGAGNVLRGMGLPPETRAYKVRGMENAFYHGARGPEELALLKLTHPGLYRRAARDAKREGIKGLVAYGKGFDREGVLAHEGGHGLIDHGEGLETVNQKWFYPLASMIGPTLAGLAAIWSSKPLWKGRNAPAWLPPLAGAGIGAGAGLLAASPVLAAERGATRRALAYLKPRLSPERYATEEKALGRAFDTYLAGSMFAPAFAGALTHGAAGGTFGR